MSFLDRLKQGLSKTRDNFTRKIETMVLGYADIDDNFYDELEETLIMADVGMPTAEKLMAAVRRGVKKRDIKTPVDVKPFLAREIAAILSAGSNDAQISPALPTVILVIGVNGAGKTTTVGKLSAYYGGQGKKVMLAAADTFRAAAVEQLSVWGERTNAAVIKQSDGSDPAAVAYDAVNAAKARKVDILLVDTAGRLQTKTNLMDELSKINRVIGRELPGAPHETWLVLDASTGQNAVSQAKLFTKAAHVTGLVLTKLDGTAKGGAVIGIADELDVPVKWIGVGEQIDDLRPFNGEDFARVLLGE